MVVPNSDGYTMYETDMSHISLTTSRYLFQHHISKYYHLYDELISLNPNLEELDAMVAKVSPAWRKRLRGRVLTHFLKAFVVHSANPQHKGNYGDYVMACNYGVLVDYFRRLIKMMIKVYGIPNRYYVFNLKRDKLFKISKVFAASMLDDTVKLVPKYERLIVEFPECV